MVLLSNSEMMSTNQMSVVAPTTPTQVHSSNDQDAPDIGYYLNLVIDQLGQLNENLRDQQKEIRAMRSLLEAHHEPGPLPTGKMDNTNNDSGVDCGTLNWPSFD